MFEKEIGVFSVILISIVSGFIVSMIPDPVPITTRTIAEVIPETESGMQMVEQLNDVKNTADDAFALRKLLAQIFLFIGVPAATIIAWIKTE
jgi:hypothetical protein